MVSRIPIFIPTRYYVPYTPYCIFYTIYYLCGLQAPQAKGSPFLAGDMQGAEKPAKVDRFIGVDRLEFGHCCVVYWQHTFAHTSIPPSLPPCIPPPPSLPPSLPPSIHPSIHQSMHARTCVGNIFFYEETPSINNYIIKNMYIYIYESHMYIHVVNFCTHGP